MVGSPGQQRVRRTLPALRGVGVHEIEPGVRIRPLEQQAPRGGSTTFQPMCGITGASSRVTEPGH